MLNEAIINIRVKLQSAGLKKSGKNKFAGFDYFELSDFLPKLNELMLEEKMNDRFYIKDGYATLELQKGEEVNVYTMPFVLFDTPMNWKENKITGEVEQIKSMQDIQYLGALNTYYKRYLYLNAFGITDGEIIDSMDNDNEVSEEKKVTERQLALLERIYQGDNLTKVLEKYNIGKLADMPFEIGKELIGKNIKKMNKNNDDAIDGIADVQDAGDR